MDKIILENRGLIYKVIKDLNCYWKTEDEWQEIYDAGEIGLINGAKTYDGERNLATYLYTCIRNEIKNHFRIKTYKKRTGDVISLNKIIGDTGDEIMELLQSDEDLENEAILNERKEIVIKILSEIKKGDYYKRLYGINCKKESVIEIAQKENCSTSNIYRQLYIAKKEFIEKWRKYYGEI